VQVKRMQCKRCEAVSLLEKIVKKYMIYSAQDVKVRAFDAAGIEILNDFKKAF